ncbi:hypothetical protein CL634_11720 [bacterium]|nr:hypothetical protein [bacterium]
MLYVHRSIFGKHQHLILDANDTLTWSNKIPDKSWAVNSDPAAPQIEEVCELFGVELGSFLDPEQVAAFKILGVEESQIPAALIQPASKFKTRLQNVIDRSLEAFRLLASSGYMETFYLEQEVLRGTSPSKYDYAGVCNYFKKSGRRINQSVLRSFHTDGKFLNRAVYSNTHTSTGRMTIVSGPQILTAPKEMRQFIRPCSSDMVVAQADFISLEPRLGRILAGGKPDRDVYETIGAQVFDGKLNREQVKKAFLPAIYGAGHRTLSALLPPGLKAKSIIQQLQDYLNFDKIVKEKCAELERAGTMTNHFGRLITPSSNRDTVIYNNWLQSSAVSVALLGFSEFLNKLPYVTSLFLIHDAIIFEFPKSKENEVKNFLNSGIDIKDLGNFPMSYLPIEG